MTSTVCYQIRLHPLTVCISDMLMCQSVYTVISPHQVVITLDSRQSVVVKFSKAKYKYRWMQNKKNRYCIKDYISSINSNNSHFLFLNKYPQVSEWDEDHNSWLTNICLCLKPLTQRDAGHSRSCINGPTKPSLCRLQPILQCFCMGAFLFKK